VEKDLDTSLSQLRTDYVDSWLMHFPVAFKPGKQLQPLAPDGKSRAIDTEAPGISETWKEVVRLHKESGKMKSIGVSNFTVEHLRKIMDATGVAPMMNQIEAHPSLIQPELFKFCE